MWCVWELLYNINNTSLQIGIVILSHRLSRLAFREKRSDSLTSVKRTIQIL